MRSDRSLARWIIGGFLFLFGASGHAGPGELDVRFGRGGWMDLPVSTVTAAVSLPDGSIAVAGYQWPIDALSLVNPLPEQRVTRIAPSGAVLWTRSLGSGFTNTLQRLRSGRLLVALSGGDESRYYSSPGEIVALREDGSTDTSFGTQGRILLNRNLFLTGTLDGSVGVFVQSIREQLDGSLLVGAWVPDDSIPTPMDPAPTGVFFKLSASGQLLSPPGPALSVLRGRGVAALELLPDGRGVLIASFDRCYLVSANMLFGSDAAGALGQASAVTNADWPIESLAMDEALQRFYVLGFRGGVPTLQAMRADGTPDPGFGASGTGSVPLVAPNAWGQLWVDQGGSILAAVAEGFHSWEQPELLKQAAARAEVAIERWNTSGRTDSRIQPGNVLSLAGPVGRSSAIVSAIAHSEPGYVWIATSVESESPSVGRLAKLQLGSGSGPGTIGFERTAARIGEQESSRSVRVVRSGGSAGAVSVRYEIPPLAEGLVAASGMLSWADGDASARTIALVPRDDALLQGERSQTVRLADAQGGASLASESLTVTIEDDDVLARLQVGVAAAQIRAGEAAKFLITLDRPVVGPVSVTVLVGDTVDSTGAPLFMNKNNSGSGSMRLVWNAGQSGQQVFSMGTNSTRDAGYAVDLHLRLATDAGWLVRTSPGGAVVGTTTRVVGGSGPGTVAAGSTSNAGSQGGGATGPWSLALLGCLLAVRAVRAAAKDAAVAAARRL